MKMKRKLKLTITLVSLLIIFSISVSSSIYDDLDQEIENVIHKSIEDNYTEFYYRQGFYGLVKEDQSKIWVTGKFNFTFSSKEDPAYLNIDMINHFDNGMVKNAKLTIYYPNSMEAIDTGSMHFNFDNKKNTVTTGGFFSVMGKAAGNEFAIKFKIKCQPPGTEYIRVVYEGHFVSIDAMFKREFKIPVKIVRSDLPQCTGGSSVYLRPPENSTTEEPLPPLVYEPNLKRNYDKLQRDYDELLKFNQQLLSEKNKLQTKFKSDKRVARNLAYSGFFLLLGTYLSAQENMSYENYLDGDISYSKYKSSYNSMMISFSLSGFYMLNAAIINKNNKSIFEYMFEKMGKSNSDPGN